MGEDTYVPVSEFYAGKSVLITGGAGFLGKVFLEKLLYSCPKVDKVFVLLRDKKNDSIEQRLEKLIELPIFSRLKKERPEDLKKIVPLKGDISRHYLSLQDEDLETVLEKVSVVIHSAATVKFTEPLKVALDTNLEGTRNMLNLCHLMRNLQVFVHISTAYCNSHHSVIEERIYPPPVSVEDAYKFVKEEPSEAETQRFLNGRPNTYTFTKAMAEHLVSETHGDIPTVIIRPSIVTASKEEPVKGWIDNWYGATGFLTVVATGTCRVIYSHDDNVVDLIPVDYVCNLTLVAAARAKRQSEVAVYNSSSGATNPITMKEVTDLFTAQAVKNNFNKLPYPSLMLRTQRYWLVRMITLFTYFIAYCADLFIRLTGKRPKYIKLVTQGFLMRDTLKYFTSHSWLLKTDNSESLIETLSSTDARKFPFLAKNINWPEYMEVFYLGIKKYLLEKK